MRWLAVKRVEPEIIELDLLNTNAAANDEIAPHDVLGRPLIAPPFKAGWMLLATVAAAIAMLAGALS